MEYARVTTQLTEGDILAYTEFLVKGRKRKWRMPVMLGLALILFIAFYPFAAMLHNPSEKPSPSSPWGFWTLITVLLLAQLGLVFWRRWMLSKGAWRKENSYLFRPHLYQVLDEGLYVENERGQFLTRWPAFERIVETAKYFYVMETRRKGHIFPKRCFPTPDAAAEFGRIVRDLGKKHAASRTSAA